MFLSFNIITIIVRKWYGEKYNSSIDVMPKSFRAICLSTIGSKHFPYTKMNTRLMLILTFKHSLRNRILTK